MSLQLHDGDLLVTDGSFFQSHKFRIPEFDDLGQGSHMIVTWTWITHHARYCSYEQGGDLQGEGQASAEDATVADQSDLGIWGGEREHEERDRPTEDPK